MNDLKTTNTKRQDALAKHIGLTYCKTDRLIPLGGHSSLSVPTMPLRLEIWATERLCDVAWWVVADRLGQIDHAWLFGWPDNPREPWGFITEPYIDPDGATNIVRSASDAMPIYEWGVEFFALDSDQGSWNPPHCIPIVAVSQNYGQLIRKALPIALGLDIENDRSVA